MNLDISFDNFFDRPEVKSAVERIGRAGLSKAGAFVRQRARTSIRTRKAVSEPGKPPSNRTGLLKQRIFFAFDAATESVVVGPQLLNGSRKPYRAGRITVPELLEKGGTVIHWRTKKPATYQARPYMLPALELEAPNFTQFFASAAR